MPNLSEKEMQSYYSRIHGNDREILNSDTCSCLFCRQTYSARTVSDWSNNEDGTLNAICPICGMEAVVGDKKEGRISHEDLKELNLRFFGENYMDEHPEALMTYVARYHVGAITKKKSNEELFKHYLTILANKGEEDSAFMLGGIYLYGSEWTEKDLYKAMTIYTLPLLSLNGYALTQIGQILQEQAKTEEDHKLAMEFYSKAMAMDISLASMKFADCYLYGLGVEKDMDLAMAIYSRLWMKYYPDWCDSLGVEYSFVGDLAYRMGLCLEEKEKDDKDDDKKNSLLFYLTADYIFKIAQSKNTKSYLDSYFFKDVKRDLNAIAVKQKIKDMEKMEGYKKGKPIGDLSTLEDTLFMAHGFLYPAQKYTLHLDSYDETTGEIRFAIFSDREQFIIDSEELFAGFVPGHTWWTAYGKIIESVDEDVEFNYIELTDDKCLFVNADDDGDKINPVLYFEISEDQGDPDSEILLEDNLA